MNIQGNRPPEGQEIARSGVERNVPVSQHKNTATPTTKPTGAADRIDISRTSKEVAEIMAAIAKLPDVREEKVKALQEAIRSGSYTPDARKIAAKMLEEL